MDSQLRIVHKASVSLEVFRHSMPPTWHCGEFSHHEGEQMAEVNGFEDRAYLKSVRAVRGNADYYIQDGREELLKQVWLESKSINVAFWPDDVGGWMDHGWGMQ